MDKPEQSQATPRDYLAANARSLPGFAPDSRSWVLGLFWLDSVFSSVSSISCVQLLRQPPSLPRFGLGLPCFSWVLLSASGRSLGICASFGRCERGPPHSVTLPRLP